MCIRDSVSSGAKNPWHTDDKKYGIKNQNIKGLVFIIYLNDVYNGEFQAIKGSHLFSEDFNHPNFDTNIIKTVTVFDIFQGENLPLGKKSVAINVIIQAMDKTLSENDLDDISK